MMHLTRLKLVGLCLVMFTAVEGVFSQAKKYPLDYVNSYIGTARSGGAGLIPCVNVPFAMTSFTAQTREKLVGRMPYEYEDTTIMSFLATHQPSLGMGDYGYVSLMPQIGELRVQPKDRHVPYSHSDEVVRPYYYSVKTGATESTKIKTEIAGYDKAGIFRVTFPAATEARFVVQTININEEPDPDSNPQLNYHKYRSENMIAFVKIDKKEQEITGYNPDRFSVKIGSDLPNFKGYFVIKFDQPFSSYGCWDTNGVKENIAQLLGKKRLGAYVNFKNSNGRIIKAKIGTSFISLQQARENLDTEIKDFGFEAVVENTKKQWEKSLNTIIVDGGTDDQKTIFYTALYHTMLQPRSMTEGNRYYSGFDDKVHKGVSYTDYALENTSRALHPLLIITQPDRVGGMVQAMLQMYEQGDKLPIKPNPAETNIMIGTYADDVIADAYIKGVTGFDKNLAYKAMLKDVLLPPAEDSKRPYVDRDPWTDDEAQAGLTYYKRFGYVPADKTAESVSRTIAYAISDFSVAQVAKLRNDTTTYKKLMHMSKNYKNLYNGETGFMAPRMTNRDWLQDANAGFTEGGPWTYRFGAVHDIGGMTSLMGLNIGQLLDENFAQNHYKHDNVPSHHYVYLYNYLFSGGPWKTQKLVREQLWLNYKNQPNGINGNDGSGQMSAWAVFAALGFYPLTPATGVYAIGAPQFPKININTKYEGKPHSVTIEAKNISERNMYIQKATLDGAALHEMSITHTQLMTGQHLIFEMGPERPKDSVVVIRGSGYQRRQ